MSLRHPPCSPGQPVHPTQCACGIETPMPSSSPFTASIPSLPSTQKASGEKKQQYKVPSHCCPCGSVPADGDIPVRTCPEAKSNAARPCSKSGSTSAQHPCVCAAGSSLLLAETYAAPGIWRRQHRRKHPLQQTRRWAPLPSWLNERSAFSPNEPAVGVELMDGKKWPALRMLSVVLWPNVAPSGTSASMNHIGFL